MEILNDKIKSIDNIPETTRTKALSASSLPNKDLLTPHAGTK